MRSRLFPHFLFLFIALSLFPLFANAQPPQQLVRVIVTPDRPSWEYKVGEKPIFIITVLQFGNPLDGLKATYKIGPEKMDPVKTGTVELKNGSAKVEGITMTTPGFVQCSATVTVNGKDYNGLGAAGFDPLSITPSAECPKDFTDFWNNGKAELAKIPMDARMTLLPEKCTATLNVYEVNLQNWGYSRLYGILCVPKKAGRYPALLWVPGAGVRGYSGETGMADRGMITFQIGIHGVPVTLDPGVYNDMGNGMLNNYMSYNLDNRDTYYYRRVYLGCVRAVDFIASLPEFDGQKIAVAGGSQGGALSVITAALDSRVKWIGVYYPALCDLTGYLKGRAGGWPHLLASPANQTKERIETSKYYDVVNFARILKAPGLYTWGYIDVTCPPTSMYAAYNVITAPKELYLAPDTGHWNYTEQSDRIKNWLADKLTGK